MKQPYIQTWVSRFTAVTTYHGMFPSMLEHALFQVLWQVVWDNKDTFDDALSPSVRSCGSGQRRPGIVELTNLCSNGDGCCIVPFA